MRTARFEQIAAGAFFLFEPRLFSGSVMPYDARVANQTIISSWGTMPFEVEEPHGLERVEEPPIVPAEPSLPVYPLLTLHA